MNIKRTKLITTTVWIICIAFAAILTGIYHSTSDIQTSWRIVDTTLQIFDSVILVSSVATYTYFFTAVKKIDETKEKNESSSRAKRLLWKNFKVPTLMVSTFILFNITGTILSTIGSFEAFNNDTNHLLQDISYILDIPAFSADAFTYMLLKKRVRKRLSTIRRRSNQVRSSCKPNNAISKTPQLNNSS